MISNDELLMEFKNIVKPLYINDNFYNHIQVTPESLYANRYKTDINKDTYIVRIPRASGNMERGKYSTDFYTLIAKTKKDDSHGKYSDIHKKTFVYGNKEKSILEFYIPLKNKQESLNCFNYITTFFVRQCLMFTKNTTDLQRGEMKAIPWFNFSDPIFDGTPEEIDMALFKKYNISQEIIDHILEILPNYYDLDLDKYKG